VYILISQVIDSKVSPLTALFFPVTKIGLRAIAIDAGIADTGTLIL
jgi:hypothetical protein